MIINKSFNFRIYPTKTQMKALAVQFGQTRFVYNFFLRKRIDFYSEHKGKKKQGLSYYDTANMLTELKKQAETTWLQESSAQVLQQSLRHLDVAYNNFFNKHKAFPKFKKKRSKQTFTVPQRFRLELSSDFKKMGQLIIPKITPLKIIIHRQIEGIIKHVTIKKNPSGKYFASFTCKIEKFIEPKKIGGEIGIDLGLKSFLTTSKGKSINSPRSFYRFEKKLKHFQRSFSRKIKGSSRQNKTRIKIACIHEKIFNQRKDFLHKLSHQLVDENQAIFAEDLHVKGLVKNHFLSKSILDSGWSEFIRQVKYKSEWSGVYFGQIDRFFPSSKRCNNCGWINESLMLSDRKWLCQNCERIIDRDINAAQNILQFGKLEQVPRDTRKLLKRPGRPCAVRQVVELGTA